jgi:hypothetical protein
MPSSDIASEGTIPVWVVRARRTKIEWVHTFIQAVFFTDIITHRLICMPSNYQRIRRTTGKKSRGHTHEEVVVSGSLIRKEALEFSHLNMCINTDGKFVQGCDSAQY